MLPTSKKVPLLPGHSLVDFVRTTKDKDLSGCQGRPIKVTETDLEKHSHSGDAWMVLKGKVYNVTPYMDYHPGGKSELLRGVGGDGTDLFNENHSWVNFESLLQPCFVGYYVGANLRANPSTSVSRLGSKPDDVRTSSFSASCSVVDDEDPAFVSLAVKTSQTLSSLTVAVLVQRDDAELCDVLISVKVKLKLHTVRIRLTPNHIAAAISEVSFPESESNKINIRLPRSSDAKCHVSAVISASETKELCYYCCDVLSSELVTHDTLLLTLKLPDCSWMIVPIGHHVYLRCIVKGITVSRPYTPVVRLQSSVAASVFSRTMHLMIKVYADGILSPSIRDLKPGDKLHLSQHEGDFNYSKLACVKNLILLAAGTGITPMIRLLLQALEDGKLVTLMFFNKTVQDILWKSDLEHLYRRNERSFKCIHVLSRDCSADFDCERGTIELDLIRKYFAANAGSFVCFCGPNGFIEKAQRVLLSAGWTSDSLHAFRG